MSFISEVVERLYLIYSKCSLLQRFLEYSGTTVLSSSLYTPKSSVFSEKCTQNGRQCFPCLTRVCLVVQGGFAEYKAPSHSARPKLCPCSHSETLKPPYRVQSHACGCLTHLTNMVQRTFLFYRTSSSCQGSNSLFLGDDWCLYAAFQPDLEPLLAFCQEEDLV